MSVSLEEAKALVPQLAFEIAMWMVETDNEMPEREEILSLACRLAASATGIPMQELEPPPISYPEDYDGCIGF